MPRRFVYFVLLLFSLVVLPWIYGMLQLTDMKNEKFYSNLFYFTSRPEFFSTEQILLLTSSILIGGYLLFYVLLGIILKFFSHNLKAVKS